MAGVRFTVKSGSGQQFTGAPLAQGATVWNVDLVNGVWISSDRNVFPGNGLLLPAQASCDWTGDQLFACLDTGNTVPVIIQVSDDVQNVTNPVGIAEAIALIGLPSVFQDTPLITNLAVPSGSLSQVTSASQFGSLIIIITTTGSDLGYSGYIEFFVISTSLSSKKYYFCAVAQGSSVTDFGFIVPVLGDSFAFVNSGATLNSYIVNVVGTNRVIPALSASQSSVAVQQAGVAFTGGLPIYLATTYSDGDIAEWSFNVSATGRLTYSYYDSNAALGSQIVGNMVAASLIQEGTVYLPLGVTQWFFTPAATAAAQAYFLTIVGRQQ